MDRELIEQMALMAVSSELYYDLADNLDITTDEELYKIIKCNGNYRRELKEVQ